MGYRGNLFYDLAKNAVVRLAYAMAGDLHAHRVTALAVTPGFLRSEHVLDHFDVTEANWRDAIDKDPYFAESETPCYVGRAVAALAADPHVAQKSRTAVLELGIGEGVRLHGHRRTTAGLGQLLPAQRSGNPRTGDAAGRDGPFRDSQPSLPGRARPVRGRGSRPPARLAGPAPVAQESVVRLRVAPRAGRRPAILRNACDAAAG